MEGLEELSGPGFTSHCMTLGQSVHLSEPESPRLQSGYSKWYFPYSKVVGEINGIVHMGCSAHSLGPWMPSRNASSVAALHSSGTSFTWKTRCMLPSE